MPAGREGRRSRSGGRQFERQGKDRSGAILVLAGLFLILASLVFSGPDTGESAEGIRGNGEGGLAEEPVWKEQAGRQKDNPQLSGCLRIAGSSSMERYVSALAEGFMENYPDVDVTVQFTGSSAGIAAVTGGSADIGLSSRDLTEEEREPGAVENLAGLDGIAVCANPANGVGGLTGNQLAGIYTGGISNWQELGGNDMPIVVIGREAGSGTRDAFERFLEADVPCAYANELDSTGAVLARILSTPGAVGYVSLEAAERVKSGLTILLLDGVEPSMETVEAGSYPLYHPLFMVTRGETALSGPLVREWFAYIYGEEGRAIRTLLF